MTSHLSIDSIARHVPDSWAVIPFRRMARERGVRNLHLRERALSLSSTGSLYDRTEETDRQFGSEVSARNGWVVMPGDLVVNPMWLLGGAIGVSAWRGSVSPDYRVYALSAGLAPRFVHHLLRSRPYLDQYRLYMRAETTFDRRVSKEDFGEMPLLVPPFSNQRAIADYLDGETARIDGVLRARRRFVAVLQQRRAVVIGDAVAGRLRIADSFDGSVTPRPLRAFAEVALGRARSPETAEGEHMVPYLRAANVKDGQLDLSSVLEMNFTPEEQRRYALMPGDVLVTEGAGSLAAVGATARWQGEIAGTVCFQNHLLRIRAMARSDPRFLAWWARFAYESGLFGSIATGAQILNLGAEHVRSLPVRLPEMEAQRQVADYLDRNVGAIEKLIETVDSQIDLLLERRQSLVTAAVTGQLEIAGVAA